MPPAGMIGGRVRVTWLPAISFSGAYFVRTGLHSHVQVLNAVFYAVQCVFFDPNSNTPDGIN
jgi:hypothetical protein